jgi:hypothetical protein
MNIYSKTLINPRLVSILSINNQILCRRLLNYTSSFKIASFQTNVETKRAKDTDNKYNEYLKHVDKKKALMNKKLVSNKNINEKNEDKNDIKYSPLFKPINIEPNESTQESNIGEELVGKLDKCLKFTFS